LQAFSEAGRSPQEPQEHAAASVGSSFAMAAADGTAPDTTIRPSTSSAGVAITPEDAIAPMSVTFSISASIPDASRAALTLSKSCLHRAQPVP